MGVIVQPSEEESPNEIASQTEHNARVRDELTPTDSTKALENDTKPDAEERRGRSLSEKPALTTIGAVNGSTNNRAESGFSEATHGKTMEGRPFPIC